MAAAGNYKNYNYQVLTVAQVDAMDANLPLPVGVILSQLVDAAYAVLNGEIANGSITLNKLEALTAGQMIVGSAGNVPTAVAPSGNIKLSNAGEMKTGISVKNTTGSTIAAGKLVFPSINGDGTVGLALADVNGFPASHVTREAIANNATGFIYESAIITGLNTNAANVGDQVYVGSSGAFSFTPPNGAGQIGEFVGLVAVKDAANGSIFFFPGPIVFSVFGTPNFQDGSVTPAKQSTAARTRAISVVISSLPAPTGADQNNISRYLFTAPQAGTLVSASIISSVATSGSGATNKYLFNIKNSTSGNNFGSADATTQGAELGADSPKSVTIDQNQSFNAGAVIQLVTSIKDDGGAGPTSLASAVVKVELVYTI